MSPLSVINYRAPRFLLARTSAPCAFCSALTPLVAIALPPPHESLTDDDTWQVEAHNAFVFEIEFLLPEVRTRLKPLAPFFRPGLLSSGEALSWANHCERCSSLLDDTAAFCEPDGAFLPTSESAAARITLIPVNAAFGATAAGYACEPEFFAAMSRE